MALQTGDSLLALPIGSERERVFRDTIRGNEVNMEMIVLVEPTELREYDSDQHLVYLGKSIQRGQTSDPIWMIFKIEYDANYNETSRKRASNAWDQKWDDRASLAYL